MTFTYATHGPGPVNTVIAAWTSDGSGDASGTCTAISGEVIKAVTDPGAAAPTADYDIVLTDADGLNILTGANDDLTDRHTSTTQEVYFWKELGTNAGVLYPVVNGPITFTVSNAGDTKTGTIKLFWKAGVR
jgi:hypothetical protein